MRGSLYFHPAVEAVAVVARPDEKWGETPCAFAKLKAGYGVVSEQKVIDHCRAPLVNFKAL